MNTLADTMALSWAGIEGAMKFANSNPEYRQQVELLVEAYFVCIDEMAAKVECRRRRANLG
jgi:hypothetical protein